MEALTNATWHVEDVRQHHSDLGVPFPHRGQVHLVNLRLDMERHMKISAMVGSLGASLQWRGLFISCVALGCLSLHKFPAKERAYLPC